MSGVDESVVQTSESEEEGEISQVNASMESRPSGENELVALGKQLGLKDEKLVEFVERRMDKVREEARKAAREEREREEAREERRAAREEKLAAAKTLFDEKKLEWEKEKEKARIEREERAIKRQQDKEEREAQERREHQIVEVQAQADREKREWEHREKEAARVHQLKEQELTLRADWADRSGGVTDQSFKAGVGGQAPIKVPYFDESKDDLDAYLRRFERLARVQDWEKET